MPEIPALALSKPLLAVGALVLLVLLGVLAKGAKARGPVRRDRGKFQAVALLNKSEVRVHALLEPLIPVFFGRGARLMAQVSMGEYLKSEDRSLFFKINQKRVDFLVVNGGFDPVCVIEYQGSGHYGFDAAARAHAEEKDELKRRTFAAAGIPMVEIPAETTEAQIRKLLKKALATGSAR